jgi:hypothetical protein
MYMELIEHIRAQVFRIGDIKPSAITIGYGTRPTDTNCSGDGAISRELHQASLI